MAGDDFRETVRWPVPEQAVAVEAFADGATDPLSMRPYAEVLADMAVAPQTPTPLAVLIDGPWASPERLAQLDDSLKPWLRLPPRRAKRLYNHARLLYALSLTRDVLGSTVTPRDVGLWAVLSDTWPAAAEVVARFNEDLWELVRHRTITDKEREEGLAELLESARLSQRELAESKAFLVRLIRAAEIDKFLLAVPLLAGLLPYQEQELD